MKKKSTYIIGYSIDACIYARSLANKGEHVVFMQTGILGYPYDDIGDYVFASDVAKICKVLGEQHQFDELINSRYVYMPYEDLRLVNSKNGLISYPLNKLSFESAEELDEVIDCAKGLDIFIEKMEKSTNYINMYKAFFPKWLYDSVIKYIAVNKWGGLRQSKLTRKALLKELDLSMMNGFGTGIVYRPTGGYKNLCEQLISHKNIKVEAARMDSFGEMIKTRYNNANVIFMDNRIDMFIGFHNGALDRTHLTVETTSEQGLEEFIDVNDGIVFTPRKEYWCCTNKMGVIQKIYSRPTDKSNEQQQSIICPTITNVKIIEEYSDLLALYSGKQLNLKRYVGSVIL